MKMGTERTVTCQKMLRRTKNTIRIRQRSEVERKNIVYKIHGFMIYWPSDGKGYVQNSG